MNDQRLCLTGRHQANSDHFSWWLATLDTALRALSRRERRNGFDEDDTNQDILLGALMKGPSLAERYANPATYARVRKRHADITRRRREASQRGQGSDFSRVVHSVDAPHDPSERSIHEIVSGPDDADLAVLRRCEATDVRAWLSASVEPRDARALLAVRGWDISVSDYASVEGCARETLSRRLGIATATLRRQPRNMNALP